MEGGRNGGREGGMEGGREEWREGEWRQGGMEGWRNGGMEGWRELKYKLGICQSSTGPSPSTSFLFRGLSGSWRQWLQDFSSGGPALQSLPIPTSYTSPKETAASTCHPCPFSTSSYRCHGSDRSLCAEDCGEWLAV